jgi:hypothetical protein
MLQFDVQDIVGPAFCGIAVGLNAVLLHFIQQGILP